MCRWVGTAYLITSSTLNPMYGRLSDMVGRKPPLFCAIAVFLLGSALCGASQSIVWLCASRGVQGLGGGGILSLGQIVLSDITRLEERAKFMGLYGLVWGFASLIGPLAGGALTTRASWRWCFFINLPICGVAGALLVIFLHLPPRPLKPFRDIVNEFDFVGLFWVSGGAILFLVGFSNAENGSWGDGKTIGPIVAGAMMMIVFGFWNAHTKRTPIIAPRLFRLRTTTALMVMVFIHGLTFMAATYYLPNFYQVVKGVNALLSGVYGLPYGVISSVVSAIMGMTISKLGAYRFGLYLGFSIMTLGFGLMCMITSHTSLAVCIILPGVMGIGVGCLFQTPVIAAQAAMPGAERASTIAALMFVRQIATTMGISIAGTILNSDWKRRAAQIPGLPSNAAHQVLGHVHFLHQLQPQELSNEAILAYSKSVRLIWIVMTPLCFVAFLACFAVKGYSLKRAPNPANGSTNAMVDPEAHGVGESPGDAKIDDNDVQARATLSKQPSATKADASLDGEVDAGLASTASPSATGFQNEKATR